MESAWLPGLSAELRKALDRFDEAGTQEALDKLIATLSLEAAAREVILPYLRELGERWDEGRYRWPRSTLQPSCSGPAFWALRAAGIVEWDRARCSRASPASGTSWD